MVVWDKLLLLCADKKYQASSMTVLTFTVNERGGRQLHVHVATVQVRTYRYWEPMHVKTLYM